MCDLTFFGEIAFFWCLPLEKKIMKKVNLEILIFGAFLLSFGSCAPVYKCGDALSEKKPMGKRINAVIEERDQLCLSLSKKETENIELNKNLENKSTQNAKLESDIQDLQSRYNQLINESISQSDLLNAALKQKSEELKKQERLLADRELAMREMQAIVARQDSITKRLNDVVRNALLGFNSDELTVEIKNGKVYVSLSNKLLFRSGSATVETKGLEALKVLAEVLLKNQDIDVSVEGHTDNVPIQTTQFRDNWDLSVIRATSIVRALTAIHGVSPLRVTASGKGEFMPRASNDTAEGKALNRRTEIILSPKLDELMKILDGY
jgi:chemotaxis protein MotB